MVKSNLRQFVTYLLSSLEASWRTSKALVWMFSAFWSFLCQDDPNNMISKLRSELWGLTVSHNFFSYPSILYCIVMLIRCFPGGMFQNLTVLFCVCNSINFDEISITTGSTAAPNHDRAPTMFYSYTHLLLCLSPDVLCATIWTFDCWIHHSITSVITDFHSISDVICHTSAFSRCFPYV